MSFLTVDTYDDVQEMDFQPLEPGWYEVYAENRTFDKASTGTPFTEFVFVVRSDVEQEGKRRKIWHRFFHTEKTKGIVKAFLKALGVPTGVTFNSQEEFGNYCLGKPVKARIDVETYQDRNGNFKQKNVIKRFAETDYPAFQSFSSNPSTAEQQAAHNNTYLGTNTTQAPSISDDDLPF